MTEANSSNGTTAKAQRRLKTLHKDHATVQAEIVAAERQAKGGGRDKRKARAKVLVELRAEQNLITQEIEEIEATLPGLTEAEGMEAAAARIASIAGSAPALVELVMQKQDEEREAAAALVKVIQTVGAARVELMRGQLEIRLLRSRWPALQQPAVIQVPELRDVSLPVLDALRVLDSRLKNSFSTPHNAGADASARQRETWRALSKWLERHGKSLSQETQAIFGEAGVPVDDPEETPEHRQRREEREAMAKEAEEEFTQRSSAEGARVYREGVLR